MDGWDGGSTSTETFSVEDPEQPRQPDWYSFYKWWRPLDPATKELLMWDMPGIAEAYASHRLSAVREYVEGKLGLFGDDSSKPGTAGLYTTRASARKFLTDILDLLSGKAKIV